MHAHGERAGGWASPPPGNARRPGRLDPRMTTIGIIGSGNIGSQLAHAFTRVGHDVVVANSRGPESLGELVAEVDAQARAAGSAA
ncbi:MAG: NAD(P)-binding domain-containing protein, partial [Actinomycetes bacterium]